MVIIGLPACIVPISIVSTLVKRLALALGNNRSLARGCRLCLVMFHTLHVQLGPDAVDAPGIYVEWISEWINR